MARTNSDLVVQPLEARFGVIAKRYADCQQHGEFIATLTKHREDYSGCPACAEHDQRRRDALERGEQQKQHAVERLERRLGNALIPPRFAGKSFADYRVAGGRQTSVLNACQDYAQRFDEHRAAGRCLLLLGNVGTGKTHLGAAIAAHVVREHGGAAVYRTVHGLMQFVKASFGRDSEYTEAQAYERLIAPALLVIDEVGATKQTEFEQAALFNVINGRYEQQLPTVIISNLMPAELPAALGDRCVDRLRENGGIALVFDWGSERARAANE